MKLSRMLQLVLVGSLVSLPISADGEIIEKWSYTAPHGWLISDVDHVFRGAGGFTAVTITRSRVAGPWKLVWIDPLGDVVAQTRDHDEEVAAVHVTSSHLFYRDVNSFFATKLYLAELSDGGVTESRIDLGPNSFPFPSRHEALNGVLVIDDYTSIRFFVSDLQDSTPAPTLFVGIDGSNIEIRWTTVPARRYQIQVTEDFSEWEDVGAAIDGTGAEMVWAQAIPSGEGRRYYRVIER